MKYSAVEWKGGVMGSFQSICTETRSDENRVGWPYEYYSYCSSRAICVGFFFGTEFARVITVS